MPIDKAAERQWLAERAVRFRAIREALGVTQPVFAERLTAEAKALGFVGVSYDVGDITTRENARRTLEIEDYIVAERVDPARRSWEWLAFGRDLDAKQPATPKLGLGKATDEKPGKGRRRA